MTAWWSGNCVPFDLESDGKNPAEARIIQWYGGHVRGNRLSSQRVSLVKPERDIDPGAVEVHGISTERAADEGVDREEAVREIALWLAEHTGEETPVVGHNVGSYDFTLLDREMRRLGIGSLGIEDRDPAMRGAVTVRIDGRQVGQSFWVLDTMVMHKGIDTYCPGPRGPNGEKLGGAWKLGYLSEVYGVPLAAEAAHAADADALASARIAWAMARRAEMRPTQLAELYAARKRPSEMAVRYGWLRDVPLPDLHHKQMAWSLEQARSLVTHFQQNRDKGDPTTVDGSWPIRPLNPAAATDISTDVI